MATVEELLRELKESREREEKALLEVEKARRETKHEIQRRREIEQAAAADRRENEEMKTLIAPTDYTSYLSLCHNKLFLSLEIEQDSSRTSMGIWTKVDDKFYPLSLKPWSGFSAQHDQCQEQLKSVFGNKKHFRPAYAIDMVLDMFDDGPVADEEDMKRFQCFAVEAGTRHVIMAYLSVQKQLATAESDNAETSSSGSTIPAKLRFLNNPYGLLSMDYEDATDDATTPAYVPPMKDVAATGKESRGRTEKDSRGRKLGDEPPRSKQKLSPRPKLYPDQWCFRVDDDGRHVPIFVIEYKAAHKLRASMIQTALSNASDDGGLFADVIDALGSGKISVDEEVRYVEDAKRNTAQVLAQAFHYMIEFGLCYCYIASGEALLLLCIQPDDPRTLYYHLAVPNEDVGPAEGPQDLKNTPVALVSTLVLLALDAPVQMQRWKQMAQSVLKPWPKPYPEMALVETKATSEQLDTPRLPAPTTSGGCGDPTKKNQRRHDDEDDSDGSEGKKEFCPPRSSSTTAIAPSSGRETRSSKKSSGGGGHQAGNTSQRTHVTQEGSGNDGDKPTQYCTQACLLGLRRGGLLDPGCPNVRFHQRAAKAASPDCRHPLTAGQVVARMRRQLAGDLDEDCEGLDKYGKFGATSMLFRLSLRGYGYCLVAKGVQRPHVDLLEHERRVYDESLAEQQGQLVPVCLGIVELVCEYISYTGAHITHMLLLSYGGEPLWKKSVPRLDDMDDRAEKAWAQLRQLGVRHGDQRAPNVVWNTELQRVMCIDFGMAEVWPLPRDCDKLVSSPKRQRAL